MALPGPGGRTQELQIVRVPEPAPGRLGHQYIGTEHLVLGLLRCGPCPAFLRERGVTSEGFREVVLQLLGG